MGSLSQDPLTPVSQEKETEAQKGKVAYPIVSCTLRSSFIGLALPQGQRAAPQPSLILSTFQDSIISQRTSMEGGPSLEGDSAF